MSDKNEKKIRVLVTARPEAGFYRCGRHWPASETEAEVSADELARLQAERKLSVRVAEDSAPPPPRARGERPSPERPTAG